MLWPVGVLQLTDPVGEMLYRFWSSEPKMMFPPGPIAGEQSDICPPVAPRHLSVPFGLRA